ncbi:MAG: InlB B-repeat-containing protein, partial [Erysipelotrichales bacterium]|nr:InlB B-repeat-containing protein [Erysipelotrichales bacterium]
VNGGDALSDQTVTFGQSFTLPTPTRTGHTFDGWLHNGNPFTSGTWDIPNDITIVATWTANTYTITFDVAGGDALSDQTVTFGQSFTLPTPTRTGHTFNGWLHNGNPFTAGTWNIANDITIVATWTANTYIITFDVAGGDVLIPNTQDVTFELSYTLPTPTRRGHTFAGWYNGTDLIPLTGIWDIASNVTLVASWTANTYTITFNVNGGNVLNPSTQTVTFGQPYTLPEPTRTGHTFAGWQDGATTVPQTGASWDISPDVTLVAAWTANTYTITFNVNGGNALIPNTQTVTFGQAFTLPIPTRTGHTSNGWLHNGNPIVAGTWNIPNNVTLVAAWTANVYVVTLNVNGGNPITPNTRNVTFNASYTLPTPTRGGYTLVGWFHGSTVIPLTGVWNIASDVTLIAIWSNIVMHASGSGIRIEIDTSTFPVQMRRVRFNNNNLVAGVIQGNQTFATDTGLRLMFPIDWDLGFTVDTNLFHVVEETNVALQVRAITFWRIGSTVPAAVWNHW